MCAILLSMALCSSTACGAVSEDVKSGEENVAERKHYFSNQEAAGIVVEEETAYFGDGAVLKEMSREEAFAEYESYGLCYDKDTDELMYHGKLVRWFQDYYSLEDGIVCGIDFFNENGIVDVYTRRELSEYERNPDGSYDPAGKLIGLEEFSREEFDRRDIEAIKNPQEITAYAGEEDEELTIEELKKMIEEYAPFGVTYDFQKEQWYFNGEAVRTFQDILYSNGESLTGGNFSGMLRMMNGNGTVDICTVRDYSRLNADGSGTLIDIRECDLQ